MLLQVPLRWTSNVPVATYTLMDRKMLYIHVCLQLEKDHPTRYVHHHIMSFNKMDAVVHNYRYLLTTGTYS